MKKSIWTKNKPRTGTRPFLLLTIWESAGPELWRYEAFHIRLTGPQGDGQYWGVFDEMGEEWGAYKDLSGQLYAHLELPDND